MAEVDFGRWLTARLADSGMTQSECAEKAKVSEVSLSRYKSGKRIPDINTAIRIAEVLGEKRLGVFKSCTEAEIREMLPFFESVDDNNA